MDASLYAAVSGLLFGAMTVAVRPALARAGDPEAGACASASLAFVVAITLALAVGAGGFPILRLWPFLLAGAIVPGLSQILFVRAIRDAGPSRTAIAIGTAPLLSALIAIVLLGEPLRFGLAFGTILIVVAGIALTWEPTRPAGFRTLGLVFAFGCALLFGVRDNVVRWAAGDTHVPPLAAASASLFAAAATLLVYVVASGPRRAPWRLARAAPAFLLPGIALGLAYPALFEAFDRGRVTIVAPLNATQSLWAVLISAIVLRRTEVVGPRTAVAAILMAAGGALIGILR